MTEPTTGSSAQELADFQQRWTQAELTGDTGKLEQVLHPDFVAVGPLGFTLTKEEWLERHNSGDLKYQALTWEEPASRFFTDFAITIAVQQSKATYKGFEVPGGRFRATLVTVRQDSGWAIAGLQLSQMGPPPGAPGGPPGPPQGR
jgi:hypothetical protein